MSPARLAALVVLASALSANAAAQTALQWTGAVSTAWTVAGNWNPAQVPTAADDVLVPGFPTVTVFPSVIGLTVSCHDLFVVGGGSVGVDGATIIEVHGDALLGGALNSTAFPALGVLRLVGTEDALMVSTSPQDAALEIAKTAGVVTMGDNFFNGALTSTNSAVVVASNVTASFGDNGAFVGGSFASASATGFLDIPGSLMFTGTTVNGAANILCGVDFTADANFAPSAGEVVLGGFFPHSVDVAGSFFDLTLSRAGLTTVVAGAVAGDLAIGAASGGVLIAAGVTFAVGGDVAMTGGTITSGDAAAILDVAGSFTMTGGTIGGAFSAECGGAWSSTAGFQPTSGTVVFDGGAFQTVSATGSFANLEAAGVDVRTGPLTITGDLVVSAGRFTVLAGQTVVVQGGATFSGGEPFSANATALLDVAGGVVVSSAAPWTFARINAAGGWTATAAATVAGGTIRLDGAGPQAISGPAAFFDLILASGAAATADAAVVAHDLTVQSGGLTVLAGGLFTVGGDATFAGGAIASADALATFDVAGDVAFAGATAAGAFNAQVGGDWTATAAFAPTSGLVRFDAPVAQAVSNSGVFFAVEVAGPGTATFDSLTVADDFTTSGGATVVDATKTLVINGDAVFAGGQISCGDVTAKFDVAGDVDFQGATAGLLVLEAGRDLTTDAAFAPTGGTVTLDGVGARTVGGPGVFASVVVAGSSITANGLHATGPVLVTGGLTAGAAFDLDDDFTVAAPATFDDGGFTHCVGGDVVWLGTLTLSGVLKLDGAGATTVQKSGALASVQVAKTAGGTVAFGADCQIAGSFDVQTGAATAGILDVDGPATVAAAGSLTTTGTATFSGDLTVFGAFSVGALVFDGPDSAVVAASLPSFVVDKPGATLSLGPLTVAGSLAHTAGTLAATGALIVTEAFTSTAGTTFAAAGFTHEFRAACLADGVTTSTGVFRFAPPVGSGLFAPPINVRVASGFPQVIVQGAAGRVVGFGGTAPALNGALDVLSGIAFLSSPATVAGDVTVAGGSLFVSAAAGFQQNLMQTSGTSTFTAPTTVAGDAAFSGGTFVATAALDVADDVTFNGAAATGSAEIRVGGDWTSGPLFDPTGGVVTFDGVAPQVLFGSPTFPRLTIAAGAVVSSAAAVRAKVAATILGSFASTGSFDSDGPFTVASGGAFDLGAGTHRFGASFTTAAGALSFLAGARVVFDGATPSAPSAADVLPDVEAAKSGAAALVFANLAIGGDLALVSGRLSTGAGVVVTGDLLASGGVLTAADPQAPLVVQGGVVFSGATAEAPAIETAGDFTSDASFLPTGGTIGLFGSGSRQIHGAGLFGEANLVLRDGQTVATGSIHVDGDFTVLGPALFDASANTHFFGGDFLCLGQLGPDGAYQFEALVDQTVVSIAPLPALNVNKSGGATLRTGDSATAPTLTVANLFMSFGRLVVGANTTLAVLTDAVLNAGVFATETGAVLDVDGAASFLNVVATAGAEIRVGGAFIAGPGFEPASGAVTCDGSALQPITVAVSAASLRDFVIAPGATADGQSPSGLLVLGTTTVHGVLQSAFASSFRGPVIVEVGGSFDGGDASYDFGDDVLVFGQMIHVAQILADGTTAAEIGGATTLPPVVAAKSAPGSLQLGGTLPFAAPSLSLLSGFVFVPASTTAVVAGHANFSGGSFASENTTSILDVAGDVLLSGCVIAGTASIDVGGSFTADPDFAPTSGRIRFDGVPGTSAAPSTAGGALAFAELVVAAGTLTLATDMTIQASSVEVFSGATLRVAGSAATFGPTAFSIAGEVFVDAGGVLRLDDAAPLVVPVGASLRLAGAAASPAVVEAAGPAGFSVRVEGALSARNFRLSGPAAQGFVLDVTATIAAAPDDFRGGLLENPRAGGVLLDVRRSHPSAAATTFAYLDFENAGGAAGAANVRAPFGTPIVLTNFGGGFGGESFDDDAAGRITWTAGAQTALLGFSATPGASVVTLAWATSTEVDAAAYVIERRLPPSNVFTFIGELPANASPVGAGQGYQSSDTTPASGLSYEYRLSQRFTHGGLATLATTNVQTLLLAAGAANAFGVGSGRTFATPQDAIDAAVLLGAPRPIVRLAPGVYPTFEIGATPPGGLRIVGEGPGVFIDASAAPLRVHGLGFGGSVELRDLVIDAGGATEAALVVENCAAPVVVDGCILLAVNGPAARVSGAVGVAFQRSQATGVPGLALENGAAASICGGATTDATVAVGSKLRTVGATLGTVTTDPSSTHVAYQGAAALLDAPAASLIGGVCGVGISAAPSLPWVLLASVGLAYTPPAGIVEMPVLLDLASLQILITGTTNVAGADVFPILVPPMPQLVGFSLAFQAVVVDGMAGTVRLSSVASSSIVG